MNTANMVRNIIDGLNSSPFNRALTILQFDGMSPEKLLQTLSDVISWIEGQTPMEFIDIRSENPDETAFRILSALRLLKYPPPKDIDQIQRWRLEILEGNKVAIYPILNWIFENVDQLKERVYLGAFLTRIDIPLEEQSPEVVRLMNCVQQKMEEFKILHANNVEARADFIRVLDVQNDLKAMEEERKQLQRKIDRCRRRTSSRQNLLHLLNMTSNLRIKLDRAQELQVQKEDQRRMMAHVEQRQSRLRRIIIDEERRREGVDPKIMIQKSKREIEINQYLLNDKLKNDLVVQRKNLDVVQRILAQNNATTTDIDKLKEQIDQINSECMELDLQRDRRDEASEDKLIVYRHQAANVQRKKVNVADILQMTKQELENTQLLLSEKKRELSEKTGKDEVVTSVQYKLLLNKLRNKSNLYKRKKSEMEHMRAEQQILERTLELLEERSEQIKEDNRIRGRGIIEELDDNVIDSFNQRPKTAKPTATDINGLKQMVEQITEQINKRKNTIEQYKGEIDQFYASNKKRNEDYYVSKSQLEAMEQDTNLAREATIEKISILEQKLDDVRKEFEKTNDETQNQKWLRENVTNLEQTEYAYQKLERKKGDCAQQIIKIDRDIKNFTGRNDLAEQTQMWQALIQLFEMKLRTHQQRNMDESKPWGDQRSFNFH